MTNLLVTLLLCYFVTPTHAANLLQVSDTLSSPKTSTAAKHTISFTTDSAVSSGFFRFLISDSFSLNSPASITAADTSGYTFTAGVATASGSPNCTSPANYHCLEIHYSGSGAVGAPITITINSGTLTNPSSEGAFSFLLRHYDNLDTLISQTTGRVSIHNNPIATAKVLDYAVSNPILISPSDFAITNNPYEPFSFLRSSSAGGVDYYDLYLDDQLVAGNIDHDLLSQDYYFFKTLRQDETINILLKQPLSEGTHTWYVKAYGVSGSRKNSTSGKRSFTVDSTYPQIILTSIDNQFLNWIVPDRTDIIVRSSNPFFKGKVEALSNLKLSLLCSPLSSRAPLLAGLTPSRDLQDSSTTVGMTSCTDQSITIYEEDGNWEHRFNNLIPNHRYEVYIAATDKAGNSHTFPQFFITYEPFNIISYIFPTPSPSLRGVPDEAIYTDTGLPREYTRNDAVPPPPPSIPPLTSPPYQGGERVGVFPLDTRYLILIALFGLLLHLAMTYFGSAVPLRQHLPFLWRLLFPFMTKYDHVCRVPFTTISIFNPANLHQKPYLYTSTILGQFVIPSEVRSKIPFTGRSLILLRLTRPGYSFKDQLIHHQTLLAINELNLEPKASPTALERLQLTSLAIRWLPLLVADLTGLLYLSLTVTPCHCATVSPSAVVYLLLSLQLTYSEYIYPRNK